MVPALAEGSWEPLVVTEVRVNLSHVTNHGKYRGYMWVICDISNQVEDILKTLTEENEQCIAECNTEENKACHKEDGQHLYLPGQCEACRIWAEGIHTGEL